MTQVSDQDWELLNALADGELPDDEAAVLTRRIETEPALAETLASLRQVSHALSVLKPESGAAQITANSNRRPWIWLSGGAIAAALAVLVFLQIAPRAFNPENIHRQYVAQSFSVEGASDLQQVSDSLVDGFPSLADANLTLAVTSSGGAITSAHYVGVNGCRLTVLRGTGDSPDGPHGLQSVQWNVAEVWYQAIATGMDQGKFDAVTEYLMQTTRSELRQTTVLALQGAVSTAAPCA